MTAYRKVIIVFYIVLVTVVVTVPLLDGLGYIVLKENTSWLIAQIVVATAVPVAIAVLKTTDFFRDDPNDVARLKKEHLEAMAKKDAKIAQMKAEHVSEVARALRRPSSELIKPGEDFPTIR